MGAPKKRTKNTSKNKSKEKQLDTITKNIIGVISISIAVFIYAGLHFPQKTGVLGNIINFVFRTLLGEGANALPFLIAVVAVLYLWPFEIENFKRRFFGFVIVFCLLVVTLHLRLSLQELSTVHTGNFYSEIITLGWGAQGGGILGALLTALLLFLFRDWGSYIFISCSGIVALLLITNTSVAEISGGFARAGKVILSLFRELLKSLWEPQVEKQPDASHQDQEKSVKKDGVNSPASKAESSAYETEFLEEKVKNFEEVPGDSNSDILYDLPQKAGFSEPSPEVTSGENSEGAVGKKVDTEADEGDDIFPMVEENKPYEEYKIPPVSFLTRGNKLQNGQQQKVIQDRAKALENTFQSFGVNVKIKDVQAGPAVTRFEIQPETGVKVSKILSLSDDLALNLAASDVRIEAPIPGKAAIGIEVPNKIVSLVYLREVLEDPQFQNSTSPLTIALGKEITGVSVFADLLKMPHLLIAGSTGAGKSVCINSIICSILFKASPWVVKFLMIDPKMVELNIYNGIPHLISPVVTEAKKASVALRSMVKEMERRYDLFANEGVRDISRYNEKVESGESDPSADPLPYIVVVIDELADLMMISPSEVEDSIVRLSQMARAAGIHLVIATQRPSVDVITGLIKANITSRIAFAVSSQTDSRTILDVGGAEKLLGRGDMLYYPLGVHRSMRVQGAFISEKDINKVVDYVKKQKSPLYQLSFVAGDAEDDASQEEGNDKDNGRDPLVQEAVELVIKTGHASISLLQRRFRIGYSRAARLIDDLEQLGIVGPYEGSKPRQVLMGTEEARAALGFKGENNEQH